MSDATGVGEGITDWLSSSFGPDRVIAFKFTAISKAQLGASFLSVIETGRFHYWTDDEDDPLSDGWWFWQHCSHCQYEVPPGGTFERHLKWEVPASATVSTPTGREPVHDDRLLSAALVAQFDELVASGELRTGRAEAVVIAAEDPLDDMRF